MPVTVCPACENIEQAQSDYQPCKCGHIGTFFLFMSEEEATEWLKSIGSPNAPRKLD